MEFNIDKRERFCIVKVNGDKLLSSYAPELKAALLRVNSEGFKNIILDLGNVQYIDSSGLSVLLVGNKLSTNSDGTFVATNLNQSVQKLIKLSQLDSILTTVPTLSESIDYVMMEELDRDLRIG